MRKFVDDIIDAKNKLVNGAIDQDQYIKKCLEIGLEAEKIVDLMDKTPQKPKHTRPHLKVIRKDKVRVLWDRYIEHIEFFGLKPITYGIHGATDRDVLKRNSVRADRTFVVPISCLLSLAIDTNTKREYFFDKRVKRDAILEDDSISVTNYAFSLNL